MQVDQLEIPDIDFGEFIALGPAKVEVVSEQFSHVEHVRVFDFTGAGFQLFLELENVLQSLQFVEGLENAVEEHQVQLAHEVQEPVVHLRVVGALQRQRILVPELQNFD